MAAIRTLFTDIGGVLLTNGWDRAMRMKACEHFNLDASEVDERHHLTFDTYEIGKLSLDEYLKRTIFYEPRQFTTEDFRHFMFEQSQPLQGMAEFVRALKAKHSLKVVAISNEGRELAHHRIHKFKMGEYIDAFVVSGFVYTRKPDESIFRLALDIVQATTGDSIYMDDRLLFVEVASSIGFQGIHHTSLESTTAAFAEHGLSV